PALKCLPRPRTSKNRRLASPETLSRARISSRIISALNALFFSSRLSHRVAKPRGSVCSSRVLKSLMRFSRSHPEHAEAARFDWRVQRRGQGQGQHVAGLRRVNDTVIPQPCTGVVRVALFLVLIE